MSTFKAVHWDSYDRAFKKRDVNSQTRLLKYFMVGSQWATSANALILTNPTFAPAAVVATRPACTLCDVVNTNVSIFLISKFPKSESTLKNERHTVLSQNHADGTKTQTTNNNNYQTDSQQSHDPYERR